MPAHPTLAFSRDSIQPGDRICAAVSGGADSTALLLALHSANTSTRNSLGVGLSAAHVHHGLRGAEADADLAFVQDLCHRLDIPLHIHHASVPDRVAHTGETIEEAARNLRYAFFTQLIVSGQANSILTAHTLDDQAETVLMKFLRGAWTRGLSGIHPVLEVRSSPGGRILRPLLDLRRTEIEAYLQALNQPWREDSSNSDTTFTRNHVRHHVLPLLRQLNPALDHALANLAELARDDEAFWQQELTRSLPQLLLPGKPARGGGRAVSTEADNPSVSIDIQRLATLNPAFRRRVLRAAAANLNARLTYKETDRLLALCGFRHDPTVAPRPSTILHLSATLRAQRSPRELRLYLQ